MPHDRSKSCGLSLGDSSPKKRLAFPVQEIRPGENAFAIQERENARENDVYRFGGNAFYQQERINKGKGPGQPSPAKQPTSGGTRNSRGTNGKFLIVTQRTQLNGYGLTLQQFLAL